jgi:hypothetical protein
MLLDYRQGWMDHREKARGMGRFLCIEFIVASARSSPPGACSALSPSRPPLLRGSLGEEQGIVLVSQGRTDTAAQLGWVIDTERKFVHVYRPHEPVRELENLETLSGDPVLPGFELDLREIW